MTSLLIWQQGTPLLPVNLLEGLLALVAAGIVLGGMLGFVLGVGGAFMGYLLWRRQDQVYLARLAESRAMTFKERRDGWIKEELVPWLLVAVFVIAVAGVLVIPLLLLFLVSSRWADHTVLAGLGFVAVALALVLLFRHTVRARWVSDWLACVCFASGIWLTMSGTALEGLAYLISGMVIPFIYVSSVIAAIARVTLLARADTAEVADEAEAERPAAVFRDDGTTLVF